MKNTSSYLLLFFSVFASCLTAAPSTIHYQGLLTDTSGTALANANHSISINLYASEQDEVILYTQSFPDVVSDDNGMYSIAIGDTGLFSVLESNDSLWLELTVNEETLSPRQAIHSVPYALHAESANRLVDATDSNITGNLSVSGASSFNHVTVSGILDADRIELDSPYGSTSLGGSHNHISGESLTIDAMDTNVSGTLNAYRVELNSPYGSTSLGGSHNHIGGESLTLSAMDTNVSGTLSAYRIELDSPYGSTSLGGSHNHIGGESLTIGAMDTNVDGRLKVNGDLEMNGLRANFENAEEVRVPTPDQDNEATNKGYVDTEVTNIAAVLQSAVDAETVNRMLADTSLQNDLEAETVARQAADAAMPFKEPVLVAVIGDYNLSSLNVQYLNPDGSGSYLNAPIGSRVLLTGRSNASENGIYTIGAVNNTGTHATSLVRALDYDSADEIGAGDMVYVREGQYAGQAYVLSTSTDNFEFGVDALNFNRFTVDPTQNIYFEDGLGANRLSANRLELMGDLSIEYGTADFRMSDGVRVPEPNLPEEAANKYYVDSLVTYEKEALQESIEINRAISDSQRYDLQADVDQNELDADAAINGITSGDTVFTGSPIFSVVNYELWTDVSKNINGFVEASTVPSLATVDVSGLMNAEVLNAEKLLRVGSTEITYDGGLSTNRIAVNSPEGNFIFGEGQYEISGYNMDISTMSTTVSGLLSLYGDLEMNGYRANFEYAEEVLVPTPDQPNEAANKAYVDSVVVPSGGLIAWPAANPIPTGWSNSGLTAPMTDYIWIQKD